MQLASIGALESLSELFDIGAQIEGSFEGHVTITYDHFFMQTFDDEPSLICPYCGLVERVGGDYFDQAERERTGKDGRTFRHHREVRTCPRCKRDASITCTGTSPEFPNVPGTSQTTIKTVEPRVPKQQQHLF